MSRYRIPADPGVYTFTVEGDNGSEIIEITLGITILPDASVPPTLIDPPNNSIDVFALKFRTM